MAVEVVAPAPRVVTVIDYDITLASGKEIQHSIRVDQGDTEFVTVDGDVVLTIVRESKREDGASATARFTVEIARAHVAVKSRCERTMTLPAEKFEPSVAVVASE